MNMRPALLTGRNVPEGIRTPDTLIKSQVHCQAVLQIQMRGPEGNR